MYVLYKYHKCRRVQVIDILTAIDQEVDFYFKPDSFISKPGKQYLLFLILNITGENKMALIFTHVITSELYFKFLDVTIFTSDVLYKKRLKIQQIGNEFSTYSTIVFTIRN